VKIAFFSESYKPYLSGVTNSIETLKDGLEDLGHSCLVFSPSYPGSKDIDNVHRFPSFPAPYPGYRVTIPIPGMHLGLLKDNKIDIIHSHSPYQLGLLSMYYAKRLKVPYIFTMHTILSKYMHYIPLIPQAISVSMMDGYVRWFCNRCSCVIVPTDNVAEQLIKTGVRSRIEIVPTGIDMTFAEKADPTGIREKHGIPNDAKVLLFVGRLAKEKNLEFLFRALDLIASKTNKVFLLIAAKGPMEEQLKKVARSNIIFAGEVQYPKVLDYYAASDLFVFSSLTETQGLVLIEAMACGLPQVAVDAEGVSNVVKNGVTGYLSPLSEPEFARLVIDLLNDPGLMEKMSASSRETAKHTYSKEVFARKIELIYKSML